MTMHLERALTMLNTKKRKAKKYSKKDLAKLEKMRKDNNKFFKSIGLTKHMMDEEQWMKYVAGKRRPKLKSRKYDDPFGRDKTYSREGPNVPMSNKVPVNGGGKKEQMQYSGKRKLIGIGLMHKSNWVPIWDKEGAEEISKMRRN